MFSQARQNVKNRVEGAASEVPVTPQTALPAKPSAIAVAEQFLDIPVLDTLARINAQVAGLQKDLLKVDFQVAAALNPQQVGPGEVPKEPVDGDSTVASAETFLTGVDATEATGESKKAVLHRTGSQLAARGPVQEAKSVENLPMPDPFPGKEALELPGKVSANDLIKRVSDRWTLTSHQDQAVWTQCLARPESQNLVKDLFWWFYCERFRPGSLSPEQEVILNTSTWHALSRLTGGCARNLRPRLTLVAATQVIFKRMACNFVRLLTAVPHQQKDRFFDRFHAVMSNSVFAAFRVALPESEEEFSKDFRSRLCRLAAYWTTGADIGPSSYVLPNGVVVNEDDGGEQIEHVIQDLVREQVELEEMTSKRPKRALGGPAAGARPAGRGTDAKKGFGRIQSHGGISDGASLKGGSNHAAPDARKTSPNIHQGNAQRTHNGPGDLTGGAQRPAPVPQLRLPVLTHTAQQATPRTCWTDRGTRAADIADMAASALPAAATSRLAHRRAKDDKAAVSARAATERARVAGRSVAGAVLGTGKVAVQTGGRAPVPHANMPSSGRSSSSSTRSARPRLGRGGTDLGVPPGLGPRARGKNNYFDLRDTSPFIKYYMSTQTSAVVTARPVWKQLLTDDVCKAWDRQVPTTELDPRKKPRTADEGRDDDDDDDEEEQARPEDKVGQTPREVADAAVKKNARIVREYRKKALMRSTNIRNERATMQSFYREQRREYKSVTASQDMAHVFSNLLVSTDGDSKVFETAWKKVCRDSSRGHGKDHVE